MALTLSEIVDKMMAGSDVVLTYHDDGSKNQGIGAFPVQDCTINGKYSDYPTLPIASESWQNLTALKYIQILINNY